MSGPRQNTSAAGPSAALGAVSRPPYTWFTELRVISKYKVPIAGRVMRRLALPICLGWLGLAAMVVLSPHIKTIANQSYSPAVPPADSQVVQAIEFMRANFKEFEPNSTILIIIAEPEPLSPDALRYYDEITDQLMRYLAPTQGLWGDRLTAAAAAGSPDHTVSYVMLSLVGERNRAVSCACVDGVRKLVEGLSAPPGMRARVVDPVPCADGLHSVYSGAFGGFAIIIIIGVVVLIFCRSFPIALALSLLTSVAMVAARTAVSLLAGLGMFSLTAFAENTVSVMVIMTATAHGSSLFGRYREDCRLGLDSESAYYSAVKHLTPAIVGSGLTIAGATYLLSLAQLPYFSATSAPLAVGMIVVVVVEVTLGSALLCVGGRIGLY